MAPGHPDYKSKYFGDLRARDAAYHQGTVWPWLIGPYSDAWLKLHPEDLAGARRLLDGFDAHLSEACVGSISAFMTTANSASVGSSSSWVILSPSFLADTGRCTPSHPLFEGDIQCRNTA